VLRRLPHRAHQLKKELDLNANTDATFTAEDAHDSDALEIPSTTKKGDAAENTFLHAIKTYVLRAGRMTESERRNYSDLRQKWCIPFEHKLLNFTEVFGNTNPVTVEIGFGMGQATALIAAANPDKNYLGMEVHVPGIGRLLGEIKNRSLTNLFIIEYDAIEAIATMIPDNSVSAFHIFFPDPWPKKRHHKRRLVQRPHTDLLAKKLSAGGYLYMVTDWDDYAQTALAELSSTPSLKNKFETFAPHQSWRPMTRFEQKGIEAGRQIRELYFEKIDGK